MSSSHERNDRKRGHKPGGERPFPRPPSAPRGRPDASGAEWLWGWHAVTAALANPRREPPRRILASRRTGRELAEQFGAPGRLETVEPASSASSSPAGAAHQGVAMKAAPLEPRRSRNWARRPQGVLLMLDQVTDPQNVGAILRSAAAFGARGLVLQDRHAPALTGALAKAAAGAVDALAPCAGDQSVAGAGDPRPTSAGARWGSTARRRRPGGGARRAADGAGAGLGGRRPAPAGGRALRRAGAHPDAGRIRKP